MSSPDGTGAGAPSNDLSSFTMITSELVMTCRQKVFKLGFCLVFLLWPREWVHSSSVWMRFFIHTLGGPVCAAPVKCLPQNKRTRLTMGSRGYL